MRRVLRDNGLTIALATVFLLALVGQTAAGYIEEAHWRSLHGMPSEGLLEYLGSGAYLSALFENWESEFLQMWAFVLFTAFLFQRGWPESKDPDKFEEVDRDPRTDAANPDAPWPVRAGGLVAEVYARSLTLALAGLFIASFLLHLINSTRLAGEEAAAHGEPAPGILEHLGSAAFWFESFQNWQSEFLSTAVLIALSIVLRQKGSPESKPVGAPHHRTG